MIGRGVTVYKRRRGWTDAEQDILFCVVTRLEIGKVKSVTRGVDSAAFIVTHPLSDAEGGVIKRGRSTLNGRLFRPLTESGVPSGFAAVGRDGARRARGPR